MQTKKTKTSKLLISLIVVTALTATSMINMLPTAAFDITDGPMITIFDPKYEGMAPPFDYEGELDDYTGDLVPATWISYLTPINVSAMGADDGVTRLFYRVWNFGAGWMTVGPYGDGWVMAGGEYVNFSMDTFGTDHPCWHKVEAYYENGVGEESAHTSVWMYLDPDAPVTTLTLDPYCDDGAGGVCINANSTILLDADDGLWYVEDGSCPTGVNYTWYNITHIPSGNFTGWIMTMDGLVNMSLLVEDCNHSIDYYSVDKFGNVEAINTDYFYYDNTPPDWSYYGVTADYYENDKAKNVTGGCVNITVGAIPTDDCCGNDTVMAYLLVTRPDPEAQEGYVDIMVEMISLGGNDFYYDWCNGTIIDIRCDNEMINNTMYPGRYDFDIILEDCIGNQFIISDHFWIKPMCDVDVIEMVEPDPDIWHPEMPTAVKFLIKNNGILDVEGPVNVHLQIYEETEVPLVNLYCFDMESCIVSGMWDVVSWDDGPAFDTWTWTEKRSNSPTHSWHSQPDAIDVYESYSRDSLILANGTQGLHIPEEIEYQGRTYQVFLNFSHFVEGEAHGGVPLDFGNVYVRYNDGGWGDWELINEDPYYDTNGAWEWVEIDITDIFDFDDAEERIPTILDEWVQFNWTWYSDATDNREGWYVDDVCIKIRTGSPQPLVWQGYKYVHDLEQNETQEVTFPLNFTPNPDTWYFFEIYSDLGCCQNETGACFGDVDGPADEEGEWVMDDRMESEYWDPYNGVNNSMYFGDVCDAAVNYVKVSQDEYLLDHTAFDMFVSVPIEVEVENTGTLTKDVPVIVKVQEKLTEEIFFDNVEGGALDGWGEPGMWVDPESLYEDQWTITDDDYYSPTHSYFLEPRPEAIGQAKMWGPIETPYDIAGGLKWEANIKFNFPDPGEEEWENYGAVPVLLADSYYWDFGISIDADYETSEDVDTAVDRVNPWQGETGWFHFDADEFIRTHDMYWEERYNPTAWTDYDYSEFFNDSGGFDSLDDFLNFLKFRYEDQQESEDFSEVTFGFLVEQPDGLTDGQGFWFDDFYLYSEYPGAVIWEDSAVAMGAKEADDTYDGLDQGETEILNFTWNATDYCDFIITAEIDLDCDIDDTNNMDQTSTRIHEVIYEVGDYERIMFEDNTCVEDNDWHIVEECSLCPDDNFWWCGDDATEMYLPDANDVLMINHTFNFTGATQVYLNFSEYYAIEDAFDYGYTEVTNDSGEHWFTLGFAADSPTGVPTEDDIPTWVDTSYLLEDGAILESPYTGGGFALPSTFFTDEVQFRFRFFSDENTEWKGWYIDDVTIEMDGALLFSDDMEDIDSSMENWTTMGACPGGNHWHNESAFGDGTDAPWWWNGGDKLWSALGLYPGFAWPDNAIDPYPQFMSNYGPSPYYPQWPDYVSYDDNSGDGELYVYPGGFGGMTPTGGPGNFFYLESADKEDQEDDWFNITIDLPDSPFVQFQMNHWFQSGTPADPEIYIGMTNGTTTQWFGHPDFANDYQIIPECITPGWGMLIIDPLPVGWYAYWGSFPWIFDVSQFAGQTVTFFTHFALDNTGSRAGWVQHDGWRVSAFASGFETIPYQEYYPNVDEKVIYEFDLTKATQAILYFDQNFSFADENDLGYVEISTDGGETWQAILVNRGSSGGWIPVELDISAYAGGDIPVQVRWRFVSNETGQDYGWMFDNVWIDGKVDYTDPMITATLNPAAPNGENGWYTSDVTVTLTATDNQKVDSIKYRIDGGSWLTYTAPFSIGIEGEHTIEFYAIDSVGNEGAIGSVEFKIDKTAPTASINVPQAGYIYFFGRELMPRILFKDKALIIGGLAAEASASDSTSGVYVVKFNEDGTTFGEDTSAPYQVPLPFSLFASHELTVTAVDMAGNSYTTSAVPYFKVF
jgi:hypothetical protein